MTDTPSMASLPGSQAPFVQTHIADETVEMIRSMCMVKAMKKHEDPTEFFLSISIICEELQRRRAENMPYLPAASANIDPLRVLKDARAEVNKQSALVEAEMDSRSWAGELWSNFQCQAWPQYSAAQTRLDTLRTEYQV